MLPFPEINLIFVYMFICSIFSSCRYPKKYKNPKKSMSKRVVNPCSIIIHDIRHE